MKYLFLISFVLTGFGLFAQSQATPVASHRSEVPVAATAVRVTAASGPATNNQTNVLATPVVGERQNAPVKVLPVASSTNAASNKLNTNSNTPQSTAVANPVILMATPQTATAKKVGENAKIEK